ncbi:LOW QUALITY PROTEIN: coiled-coil domain-containing protein 201 [Physeter macrocephalus]|uniref:LOW QUALITY PROTEIN: coiled-coil domain-containing protein 201 n=1 Tax=Physeter macrocephalus TaxID=9755 RepID=A0A9W2WNM2_PHYMC|nr:LOW QUALITY PROTEIN: coiled-coil domain-containing protein 201 [Physeter catodon]
MQLSVRQTSSKKTLGQTSGCWTVSRQLPPYSLQDFGQTLPLCNLQFAHLENDGLYQVPGLSSSEDESLPSVTRRTSLTRVLKHSTPEGAAPSWHSGLLGDVPSLQEGGSAGGSPLPVRSPRDLSSSPGELSPKAPPRKRRLSTIRASEVSGGQLGSSSDPFAFEEEPPVPASVSRGPQQRQRRSPRARRSPPNLGLPGIPNAARRRPRDLQRLAAATERLRQWEIHLLQSIEEATKHELTIEDD